MVRTSHTIPESMHHTYVHIVPSRTSRLYFLCSPAVEQHGRDASPGKTQHHTDPAQNDGVNFSLIQHPISAIMNPPYLFWTFLCALLCDYASGRHRPLVVTIQKWELIRCVGRRSARKNTRGVSTHFPIHLWQIFPWQETLPCCQNAPWGTVLPLMRQSIASPSLAQITLIEVVYRRELGTTFRSMRRST